MVTTTMTLSDHLDAEKMSWGEGGGEDDPYLRLEGCQLPKSLQGQDARENKKESRCFHAVFSLNFNFNLILNRCCISNYFKIKFKLKKRMPVCIFRVTFLGSPWPRWNHTSSRKSFLMLHIPLSIPQHSLDTHKLYIDFNLDPLVWCGDDSSSSSTLSCWRTVFLL